MTSSDNTMPSRLLLHSLPQCANASPALRHPGTGLPPPHVLFADPEPGEKEQEDLLTAEEGTVATRYERIFVAREGAILSADAVCSHVSSLARMIQTHDHVGLVKTLRELVLTYRPSQRYSTHSQDPATANGMGSRLRLRGSRAHVQQSRQYSRHP